MAAWKSWTALRLCATVVVLDMVVCKGFVEDLDESFKENRNDDIWLVDALLQSLEFEVIQQLSY
ncbi:TMX3 isoform 5 [Pan troglodytes]|uniref:Thioredoxin related transmembrane protein 3 n=2 Tax=Homininae TaxID=207598 RepID=H3BRY0_HUMAN|nr:thioredoxin related transmembrane protein 3 [Homo sapiens]KAI4046669.1 thioredoxin related transmembrane protein 3 [Homo sapiens]PNI69667.1 TMX3 isoform 5 [Pan troglodytes]